MVSPGASTATGSGNAALIAAEAEFAPDAAPPVPGHAGLREAALTALVAFGLFVLPVGIKTENAATGLALVPRFGLAAGMAVAVGLAVLIFGALRRAGLLRLPRNALLGIAGVLWLAGAALFLLPSARGLLAPFGPAADLVTLALQGAFVAGAAMAIMAGTRTVLARRDAAGFVAALPRQTAPALILIAALLPLLVAGPQQRYALDTATQVLIFVMLASGLNIVVGLAGLLDLGYVAFFAVGAYSTALGMTQGFTFWAMLPLAGCAAAFAGLMLGFPVLRLRGDYLAIVTLAFGEIIRIVLLNWTAVTKGSQGLTVPRLDFFGVPFTAGPGGFADTFGIAHSPVLRVIFLYYLILALALLTNFVVLRLRRLPIGRAWEALREDETAARALGLNPVSVKLSAFAAGAFFGGLAGAFFATRQGFISPESFTFMNSALVLAIVVLGGLGSQLGVVIAAIVLIGASEFFRDLEAYRMVVFGALMVAIMVARPGGLSGRREPTVRLAT